MTKSWETNASAESTVEGASTWAPVSLLEDIKNHGKSWEELAQKYGVTNPVPPWKTSLDGMCDALGTGSCTPAMALEKRWLEGSIDRNDVGDTAPLPLLERRWEEDELSESIYRDVPYPERQLLALVHSLIKRGLVNEEDLALRMKQVHERLAAT